MHLDPSVVPGLLLLATELLVLAVVGFVVVRVALGQTDDRLALAQGLVVGIALWGLIVNVVVYAIPGPTGAVLGWILTLTIGAGLVWYAPHPIRPRLRVAVGLSLAALALFWIVLASRQLLPNPDAATHHGLIATIRAGGPHPPELPWNPGLAAPYHYGVDLLIALLTPPVGPDPAFVTELLGTYIWVGYALVVGTLILRQGSWPVALILTPLLLAPGAQTLLFTSPGVLQIPVQADLPAPGLRASLASIYVEGFVESKASPPDVWKPVFVLGYALALVVLERVSNRREQRWLHWGTLALLVGFLGLINEAVALVVLTLWGLLEAIYFVRAWGERPLGWKRMLGSAAGPAVAASLLAAGGGVITSILIAGSAGTLSLGWVHDAGARQALVSFTGLSGGLGLLGLGPLVLAGGAMLLAWRNSLSLAFAAGSGAFLLAAHTLQYPYGQHDITRLDGHARNFALLALLLALSLRLPALRPRWRYAVAAMILALVVWPAIVSPVRTLGLAVGRGIHLANAEPDQPGRRQVFKQLTSARVAAYIRDSTPADARVLSPNPMAMSVATGRPNAAGFTQAPHYIYSHGPEYLDAIRYLDPAAVRRLGIAYVHATDAWIAGLPDRAQRWLNDPRLFQRLVQDGPDALFRVRPAYLALEAAPEPESYEALRRAVPPSARVYMEPTAEALQSLRVASALAHAQLVRKLRPGHLHLLTDFGIEPLGADLPTLIVAPHWFTPSMFPLAARQPIWWNDLIAIYAPDGTVDPIMPRTPAASPPLSVRVSDGHVVDESVIFTITLTDHAPGSWTGQDWLVVPTDAMPWGIPRHPSFGGPSADRWFGGQIASGQNTTRLTYEFGLREASLAVRADDGKFTAVGGSGNTPLGPGRWTLVLRLTRAVDRRTYIAYEDAAFIPVMHTELSEAGELSQTVYEGDLNAKLRSHP